MIMTIVKRMRATVLPAAVWTMLTLGPPGRASAADVSLSPDAALLVAPVHEALVRVRTMQAQAGPPRDAAERLIRLGALDQAGRDRMQMIDLSSLPDNQRQAASDAAWHEIDAQDAADRSALVALLPATGWFTRSRYGPAASDAAWNVVQHQTGDPAFMSAMLARMAGPARSRDVSPRDYALLSDRVAMLRHAPQTYGSQFVCTNHHWTLYALADPDRVEQRRRSLGLGDTEAQVRARIASYPPCFVPHRSSAAVR